MKSKRPSVSLVIPVYNEEYHLKACLKAIEQLTNKPLEVIVVDNNSSDDSVSVAESFAFVTLLREPRQGVVYARDRGFNAARGEIIGRIDADTLLPNDWITYIQKIFRDTSYAAVSGSQHYYDAPIASFVDRVDLACRNWLAPRQGAYLYLLGNNMAIRASAWQSVQNNVCHQLNLHEDQDLAIHLGEHGYKVGFVPQLQAGVSGRAIDRSPLDFWHYAYANIYTYKAHNRTEGRAMYPVIALVIISYVPLRLIYRGFDDKSRRFAWHRLFSPHVLARVNPTTFLVTPD